MLEASSEIKDKISMAVWLHHPKFEITSSQCDDFLSYYYFMSPNHLSKKTRAKKYYKPLHKWPRDM